MTDIFNKYLAHQFKGIVYQEAERKKTVYDAL